MDDPVQGARGPEDRSDEEPGALRALVQPVLDVHRAHPIYFWLTLSGLIAGVLVVGSIVAPELFLHEFIWKNFWGPTVTDATQIGEETRYGIRATEDYTLLSEILYGLILAGALASIYVHLFKKRGIQVDARFIGSLLPYVFFGPLARAMEDASVFCRRGTETIQACDPGVFSYIFISPFIYVLTAAAVIIHLLIAHHTAGAGKGTRTKAIGGWFLVQLLAYIAIWAGFSSEFTVMVRPVTVAALVVLSFALYVFMTRRGGDHLTWGVATLGLPMTLIPVILILRWVGPQGAWLEPIRDPAPLALPLVLGLSATVVVVVWLVARGLQGRFRSAAYYAGAINLAMIGGHMIDAFATFTAICSNAAGTLCSGATVFGLQTGGYGEKHPVSEVFLGFGDGWGFPVMKLLLVGAIIYLIDRAGQEEGEDPDLIGLVKLAVLVLGLGPGLRSLSRVAMGI